MEPLKNCLYFSASALSRNLSKMAEESFAKSGLAPSHGFTMMLIITNPGISPKEIADELHLTPSTITRFVDKLTAKKLVKRTQEGKNMLIRPTIKGKGLEDVLESCWSDLKEEYNEILGSEAAAGIAKVLFDANQLINDFDEEE